MTRTTTMHWTHASEAPSVLAMMLLRANDLQGNKTLGHGAYLCLTVPPGARRAAAEAPVPALAERLGLRNEFVSGNGQQSVAYLRRVSAAAGQVADTGLFGADAVLHVAAATAPPVTAFRAALEDVLPPGVELRVLDGVLRPM